MSAEQLGSGGLDESQIQQRFAQIYQTIISKRAEHQIVPTLERVQRVLEYLGDPQKSFRIIQITGTNGKTSTARITESLVRAYGLRTGLFTSPHLVSVTERIQIDGEPISAEKFVSTYEEVEPFLELVDSQAVAASEPTLSFFEILTVMAFAAFADAPVEVAVIEVGMGGEWDATNVADADIAIITPIGLDHQEWLGDTIAEIAATKAGIIKPGATLVRSVQEPLAAEIIDDRAREVGAKIVRENSEAFVVESQLGVGGQLLTLQTPAAVYSELFLPLLGEYQAHNALLAVTAVEQLLTRDSALPPGPLEAGFAAVTSPGRLQLVRDSPPILVDVAHNPHGATALASALEGSFNFSNLIGVIAILGDKDSTGIFEALAEQLSAVVLTSNSSPRCADPNELAEMARKIFGAENVYVESKLPDAIALAVDLAEAEDPTGMGTGAGVLVTGSVVTVGDALNLLGPRRT
jgi:dihydrofolate synthase/folylpolyglutamate synthase